MGMSLAWLVSCGVSFRALGSWPWMCHGNALGCHQGDLGSLGSGMGCLWVALD